MIRGQLAEPIEGKQHIPMKLMTNTHSAQSICQGFFFFFFFTSKWQKLFRSLPLLLVPEHCLFFLLLSRLLIHKGWLYLAKKTLHVQLVNTVILSRCDNFSIALTSSVLLQWSLAGMAKRNETTQRNHRLPSDS